MAPRKAVDHELSREKIMDVARGLFIDKGYEQASMREIARKLNYSHGAIYYHFKNKAELFYALIKRDFLMLDEKILEITKNEGDDPEETMEQIFMGYIEFGLTNQSHYEIMFLVSHDEVTKYFQEEPVRSYQIFANEIQRLTNNKVTPQQVWSVFLSLHGFVAYYCKCSDLSFQEVKSLAKVHVKLLLKSLK